MQLEEQSSRIATLNSEMATIESTLTTVRAELETATEENDAVKVASALKSLDGVIESHNRASAELALEVSSRNGLLDEIQENSTGSILRMVSPFIPLPLQPFIPFAGSILVGLFFPRGRENTFGALKSAASGKFDEALSGFTKAQGWKHTNTDPHKILEGAEKAANKQNDTVLAAKIKDARSRIEGKSE